MIWIVLFELYHYTHLKKYKIHFVFEAIQKAKDHAKYTRKHNTDVKMGIIANFLEVAPMILVRL